MDDRAIIDLIEQFTAAWNAHDLDAALALCTDDIVFESTGPAPDGERSEGSAAVRLAWKPMFDTVDTQFTTEEIFVTNDRVLMRWSYDWGDGHVRGVDVLRVRDGLVTEKLSYVKG